MILLKKKATFNSIKKFFSKKNITIKEINKKTKIKIISNIEREISEKKFSKVTPNKRLNIWNLTWGNSIKYKNVFIPGYFSKKNTFRICGDFYKCSKKFFTYHVLNLILENVFNKLKGIKNLNVLEFGAGSGRNLIFLKKKKIVNQKLLAVDWSAKSLELIKKNSKNNQILIDTYKFNFKKPFLPKLNCSVDIVLTLHALEQVFTDYKKFLKLLKKLNPKYIINIEPILENYNNENSFDLLAYKYHISRNYLSNYKTYLYKLKKSLKIKIIHDYKYYFGNKYDDSSSVLIWKFKK